MRFLRWLRSVLFNSPKPPAPPPPPPKPHPKDQIPFMF